MKAFSPDPAWPSIVELATELWGQPNKASTRDDIRFGTKGSKSVKRANNCWFDHETNEGGGYLALWRLARPNQPLPHRNGEIKPWENIDTAYDYHDADGTLLYQVVRTITGEPRFLQRRLDGNGKWIWSTKGIKRVLYHLPELVTARPDSIVYIPEGEKDVDRLRRHDRLATCNPGGAGKWLAEYGEHLRGHHVRILADNDPPGEAHARHIARKLHDIVASVRIIRLPDLPEKGDVSDWLNAGNTIDDLDRLADETPVYQPPSEPEPEGDGETEPPPDWEVDHPPAENVPKGQPKQRLPRVVNMLALVKHIRNTPAWNGAMCFNLLTENFEICPPFPPEDGEKHSPRPLQDPRDILLATMYFQGNGFAKATKAIVWDALAAVANENAYHPVRDYLNGLHWDGIERVGTLFEKYFNAEMPDDAERDRLVAYLEHASTGFMVGAVARAMQPGCKVDHIPVVVGFKQGLLKSTAIRALCADPNWFSDDISTELIDRDTKESLAGKWIIELAEIPHIRKETEKMKAFFSRRQDRYRSAYGRASQDHDRQCVFVGSSNDLEFVDVTGNRRFWPFISGEIDIAAIERDRDQLWAEAMHLYHQRVQWWLPPNIEKIANEQQDAFAETDIWEGIIADWIERRGSKPFTMEDLFAEGTGITPRREAVSTVKAEQMRAASCLKRLGWRKSRCTLNGRLRMWWQPPR
jgi:hypothetical protein